MAAACLTAPASAQTSVNSLSSVVNVVAPEKVLLKRGVEQDVSFTIQVKNGYHVNSNTPDDDYLIPLKFTFVPGPVEVAGVSFPKPLMEKFPFSNKPMSVFQGEFKTSVKVKSGAAAAVGATRLVGKLRYQACNDRMCLPPRTLEIQVPVEIRN